MLEDESGRIALGGAKLAPHVGHLVTGVVVAMRGTVDDNGVLDVSDILLASVHLLLCFDIARSIFHILATGLVM